LEVVSPKSSASSRSISAIENSVRRAKRPSGVEVSKDSFSDSSLPPAASILRRAISASAAERLNRLKFQTTRCSS
jgi:hypothetical protein